uniref:Uncharacterized protein n=1 Tax=Rhizophagus irregularis (strain DAOM 181602 / DAOM 197198 / MUCL 43194) TaxID=747089 RepID=U9UXI2_RHIID
MLYYDTIIEQFSILHKKRLQELGLKLTNAQFQEIIDYSIFLEKLSSEADHM